MRTSDILKKLNIPRHKLYYLEQKGYIKPRRIPMGELEAREYSEEDFKKLELIWKYLQSGFKHKIALQKAMEELQSPKLSLREEKPKPDLVPPSPHPAPGPNKSEIDLKR
jgi:DNA-binding transcriptional MerR regulator